jgi:hypothetical protein
MVLLAPGICSALPEDGYVAIVETDYWVVTSSKTIPGEGNTVQMTHYNALQKKAGGHLEHRASFTGQQAGDGGKSIEVDYGFSVPSTTTLHVIRTFKKSAAVWEIDPAGSVETIDMEISTSVWNGGAFVEVSSSTTLTLSNRGHAGPLNVIVNEEVKSPDGGPMGDNKFVPGTVAGVKRRWGALEISVRLKDGRNIVVQPDALKLPKAPN